MLQCEAQKPTETRESTAAETAAVVPDVRTKLRALGWMPVWFATAGFVAGDLGVRDVIDTMVLIAAGIAFAVLTYRWCDADARLQSFSSWRHFVPALYLTPGPLVMVPIYLVATRRAACARSLALAMLYLGMLCAVGGTALIAGRLLSGA
ncbi:MAG: hypothetical protein U0992_09320 [Planctomycetaceae bacterium]